MMYTRTGVVLAALASLATVATAAPKQVTGKPDRASTTAAKLDAQKLGANVSVEFAHGGALVPLAAMGTQQSKQSKQSKQPAAPASAEQEAATQIQKLLRSASLKRGITGLFVVDARTGVPLFAVNSDDELNPASNVKMISTATALELLGPTFKYPTRVIGALPVGGVVHGDVYLLGSYDPTLQPEDFTQLAAALADRGITAIEGNVIVGSDPTRDGIFRSIIPIQVTAGDVGAAPSAAAPAGLDLVTIKVTATTTKKPLTRLTYAAKVVQTDAGFPRIELTVGGTIGRGRSSTYKLWTKQRTAHAAYALIAALRARNVPITGELKTMELGDFVGEELAAGVLPRELARHESLPLAQIVTSVNKRSINWLADRTVITATALARRSPPSMKLALDAMYSWLQRHPHLDRAGVTLDTGSGLSYKTKISTRDLVDVVRAAGGYDVADAKPSPLAAAWRHSLSIGGNDGTLRHRFRSADVRGRLVGKTGTLSTVIALSGILEIDPLRPLVFSLVTNSDRPLNKQQVRKAHEQIVAEVCRYLARTAKALPRAAVPTSAPGTPTATADPGLTAPWIIPPAPGTELPSAATEDTDEAEESSELDSEAAASR